jgi:hypothetical protein
LINILSLLVEFNRTIFLFLVVESNLLFTLSYNVIPFNYVNDSVRLIILHIMYLILIFVWSWSMANDELSVCWDTSDPIFNPMRLKAMFIITWFWATSSWTIWVISPLTQVWNYKVVAIGHVISSVLLFASSIWHCVYWDLNCSLGRLTGKLVIDSPKLFGIHSSYSGPWVSDAYGIKGGVTIIQPVWLNSLLRMGNLRNSVSH